MRKLARLAIGAAALALVAAGSSCGQQTPQKNQAHEPQRAQKQAQQPEPQQQQAEPQQPQNQAQQHQAHQAQNQSQPDRRSPNDKPNQNRGQKTAPNPSQGEIRQIQQALEQKGFRVGRLDGKLGPNTKRALTEFQRKQGFQQTGMPDGQTLAALGIGGRSTAGQGPSESGGMNPSPTPSNNPTQQPAGRK